MSGIEKNENALLHKVESIDYIEVCNTRLYQVEVEQNEKAIIKIYIMFMETLFYIIIKATSRKKCYQWCQIF